MKKLFTLLLALVATTALWAEDFSADGIRYNILTDKTNEVEVTFRGEWSGEYDEYSGSVTIPSTVTYSGKTFSVTSIGNEAFYNCSRLKSVTIPNSVTSIGSNAFRNCSGLTSVTIPNSVTSIGERAFVSCEGLTSVTIGNSVTSIGYEAFRYCYGLTSVTIPNSVMSIGICAFMGCSGLTSVTIGNSVSSIGSSTFRDCTGLTSVTIGNSVTSIGDDAFGRCSSLTSVTIPNSVTSIGGGAFGGCTGLKSIVWNAEKCVKAPFYDIRYQITSFTFGDSVQYIPGYLCHGMTALTSVTIPNSVTSIGHGAFRGCTALTSVTIGNSVTSIEYMAFDGCTGLKSIESLAKTPPTLGTQVFYNVSTTIPVYVPCGSVSAYQSAEGWKAFTNIQCGSNEPSTDLENTHSPSPMTNCKKVIRDGQLIILRDGKSYSVMGQEL